MASKATTAVVKFKAVNKMGAGVKGAQRSTTSFLKSVRRNAKLVHMELRKIDSAMRGFTRMLPGIGMLSGVGAIMGGVSAVKSFAEFESMGTAIMFASDSAVEGRKNLTFLRQLSKDLAIDFRSSSEGFKMFSASVMGSKFKSADQREMFTDMSKGIRVLGLGADKTEAVFRALGEMVSKGQIMSQELKLQLGNALPNAVGNFANAIGKTKKELFDMMQKGELDPEKFLQKFTRYIGELYDPAVDESLKTTQAKLTRMSNAWLWMTNDIGEALAKSGILDYMIEVIDKAGSWVKANKEMLKATAQKGVEWIKDVGNYLINNWSTITNIIKVLIGLFVGLKIAMAALSIAAFVTNPIALATAGILLFAGAIGLAILESDNLHKKLREGEETLTWYETFAAGIGDLFTRGWGIENINKRIAGMVHLLLGAYKWLASLIELSTGGLYDASGAYASVDAWSRSVDEWASPEVEREKRKAAGTDRNINYFPDRNNYPGQTPVMPSTPYTPEKAGFSRDATNVQQQQEVKVIIYNKSDNASASVQDGNGGAVDPILG